MHFRSLMTSVIRKKRFYKEAIRVEDISPAITAVSEDSLYGDWRMWDPISSGEGDLLLDNELIVANCHDLERNSSESGMNKIKKPSEALQCASQQERLGGQTPAVKGALQSCEPRKQNDSATTADLLIHEHEDAFLVHKDSSPRQSSLLLPSESSLKLSHSSHQNSTVGAWMKTSSDVDNNIQKIDVHEEVSSHEDVSFSNAFVTAASDKVGGMIPEVDEPCPLDRGTDICIYSAVDTIDSLAKRSEFPFGAIFDNQVTEQNPKLFTGGLSPIKCGNQNSSSFSAPYHMLKSSNEERTLDAAMDENILTISYTSWYQASTSYKSSVFVRYLKYPI